MKRYISFLDILGFKNFVFNTPLEDVSRRLGYVIEHARFAECLGRIKEIDGVAHPDEAYRSVHRFSFSDSFVLATNDTSRASLNSIIVSTCQMARTLFAMQLPVRGAIVAGDADFVPGTDHLVGRGIIDAIEHEASQSWFGIMLSPNLGSYPEISALLHPRVLPMVVRYQIPLKSGVPQDGIALNWRLNITAELGTKSFFQPTTDDDQRLKLQNTLAFAKHLRDTEQAYTEHDQFWLLPIYLPVSPIPEPPTTIELNHGDEY